MQAWPPEARDIFEKSDKIIVYFLDAEGTAQENDFHHYPILGQVEVNEPEAQQALRDAVREGIAQGNVMARCFAPQHGIRAIDGKRTVDLVICFQCAQFATYLNDQPIPVAVLPISGAPRTLLNDMLERGGVPANRQK